MLDILVNVSIMVDAQSPTSLHKIHSDILDAQNQLELPWEAISICIIMMLKTDTKFPRKPNFNFHNIHSDILDAEKPI